MTRRTYAPNALEPVLSSGITGGSTSIPLDSVSGLTVPGYMVIDPDKIAKREYFKFESINGSSLETLTRGLAGSASGAQSHDAGATVRSVLTSQALDDLFLDIIDLEADQHTKYLDSEAVSAMGVVGDGNDLNHVKQAAQTFLHADLTDTDVDDHHSEAHTVASHSDTTATGAELDTLTGGAETTLHSHGAWKSWSPSYGNLTIGNGTVVARYVEIGKTVHVYFRLTLGTTSSVDGAGVTVSAPVTASSSYAAGEHPIGQARYSNDNSYKEIGYPILDSTTTIGLYYFDYAGTPEKIHLSQLRTTGPFTMTDPDVITFSATYEAA